MEKIVGYAFIDESGYYLEFEQVSHTDVEVNVQKSVDRASLFDTMEIACETSNDIKFNQGNFKYHFHCEEEKPFAIVEVTKLIHVEEVQRLIIDK